jgi:hypothetical protein
MSGPLDYFKYSGGELKVDGVSLSEIAKKNGTPVYVYSAQAFLKPLQALQEGLRGIDHLICFAVKSNSNISILKRRAFSRQESRSSRGAHRFFWSRKNRKRNRNCSWK